VEFLYLNITLFAALISLVFLTNYKKISFFIFSTVNGFVVCYCLYFIKYFPIFTNSGFNFIFTDSLTTYLLLLSVSISVVCLI